MSAGIFHCRPSHRRGFTLVEIMVTVAIIGLLAAIALPSFLSARARSQANACINNLRIIENASDEFALETGKTTGARVRLNRDLTPYIKLNVINKIPSCPAGGVYSDRIIGQLPTCSLGYTVTPAHVMP
jgi:prepilin-type N-terminal cleavage/methylation domain-containing protein